MWKIASVVGKHMCLSWRRDWSSGFTSCGMENSTPVNIYQSNTCNMSGVKLTCARNCCMFDRVVAHVNRGTKCSSTYEKFTLFKKTPNPGIRRSGIQWAARIPIIVLLLKLWTITQTLIFDPTFHIGLPLWLTISFANIFLSDSILFLSAFHFWLLFAAIGDVIDLPKTRYRWNKCSRVWAYCILTTLFATCSEITNQTFVYSCYSVLRYQNDVNY